MDLLPLGGLQRTDVLIVAGVLAALGGVTALVSHHVLSRVRRGWLAFRRWLQPA